MTLRQSLRGRLSGSEIEREIYTVISTRFPSPMIDLLGAPSGMHDLQTKFVFECIEIVVSVQKAMTFL